MIAVIDYGIGGLGLYKLIHKDFPKLPLIYFSDSGAVPYGKLSKSALRARIEKVFQFLEGEGVEKIIVACHSASSVVTPSDRNVVGLRMQTVKAVTKRKPESVGIIGGGRTIRSGFYRRELNKAGVKTSQRIAQQLSILVERGEVDSPEVYEAVAKVMRPLRGCDTILLACTHYPVLSEIILKHCSEVIDPVDELYKSIYKELRRVRTKGETIFMTTGDPKLMQTAARKSFDMMIQSARRVIVR